MEEPTTKPEAPDGQAPVEAQPEPEQPREAEQQPEEPQQPEGEQPQSDEPAQPDNSNGDDEFDYDAWLSAKGIDPSTPEGKAAIAKSWRELEKKMHQTTNQASDLEKQVNQQPLNVDTDNPLVQQALEKTNQLETTLAVRDWKQRNNITPEQDKALGQYVQANPEKAYLLKNGYLSLDDVYAMSGVNKVDPAAMKKQGGQEALQNLATKQLATSPKAGASSQAPTPKEDPIMAALSAD